VNADSVFLGKLLQSSPETIVLTNNSIINTENSNAVLIQFNTAKKSLFGSNAPQISGAEEEQYCVFSTRKQFEGCQIEVGSALTMDVDSTEVSLETQPELVLGGVEETYNKILEYTKTVVVKHALRASLSVPGKQNIVLLEVISL
jgi:peroxin-1